MKYPAGAVLALLTAFLVASPVKALTVFAGSESFDIMANHVVPGTDTLGFTGFAEAGTLTAVLATIDYTAIVGGYGYIEATTSLDGTGFHNIFHSTGENDLIATGSEVLDLLPFFSASKFTGGPVNFLMTVYGLSEQGEFTRISGTMKLSYEYDPDVAPVPLPAGLPLLAGGLALAGLIRKRRS
jgi:hypothetical protein